MAIDSQTHGVPSLSNTNLNLNLDPFHSLYFHPSDSPGTVLVFVPFVGIEYGEWKKSMIISLSAKNKFQVINGSLPKTAPTSALYPHWERCNNMVKAWSWMYYLWTYPRLYCIIKLLMRLEII